MTELGTDRAALRADAYADSAKLADRVAIYDFQQPLLDVGRLFLDTTSWPAGASVLDVGCGPGFYLRRLRTREPSPRLFGCDISTGMAAEARANSGSRTTVGDAARLPFADASADRVLAMHMLYHVADIPAAVAELRRVLRPRGVALVSTNGEAHHAGIRDGVREAGGITGWSQFFTRFMLENGSPVLHQHFAEVEVRRFRAEIVLTDPAPAVRFLASTDTFSAPQVPCGMTWNEVLERFEAHVAEVIRTEGAWRSPTDAGVFVCR